MFKRGFKAVKEEEARREQERKERRGKLWRVYFPKDAKEDYEIPFRFLTDEPVCFWEHTLNINGKVVHRTCTGEGCQDCANGNKPRFVGAFLGIDCSKYEVDERDSNGNKTGKKKTISATAKLLVRGQTDLAQLDRLNNKYGLLDREWAISKTGSGTSTKWAFDRGDVDELTEKEEQSMLPEALRGKDYYDIVESQITPHEEDEDEDEDDDTSSDDNLKDKITSGVQSIEDEDDTPKRAPRTSRKTHTKSSTKRKVKRK